jgi:hypothetical protein
VQSKTGPGDLAANTREPRFREHARCKNGLVGLFCVVISCKYSQQNPLQLKKSAKTLAWSVPEDSQFRKMLDRPAFRVVDGVTT